MISKQIQGIHFLWQSISWLGNNIHVKHIRKLDEFVTIYPADVLLFEGILVFYFPEIRDFFHMKLFVDTDADTRLSRRGNNHIIFM